jgi:hypothetical protein
MFGASSLAWLNPDGRKLLFTRMLRTFGYGYPDALGVGGE